MTNIKFTKVKPKKKKQTPKSDKRILHLSAFAYTSVIIEWSYKKKTLAVFGRMNDQTPPMRLYQHPEPKYVPSDDNSDDD